MRVTMRSDTTALPRRWDTANLPHTTTRREVHAMPPESELRKALAERARRLGVCSVFIGALPLSLLLTGMSDVPFWATAASAASVLICTWLWIRLPSTGIRIEGNNLVVTSWWSRRTYARDDISRFQAESYMGAFFVLGWTVYSGQLESGLIHAEFRDGRTVKLHGTVCNRRTARRLAEYLNRWLGVDAGSGTGPRRSRRRSD